jgi:protein-tyrosine phosphatase
MAARRLARVHHRRRMRQAARHPGELVARIEGARTILFVCLGNIIRSAFAAELLRARLGRTRLSIGSAGLAAALNHSADPTAVECARGFGVDLTSHRTHRLDVSDLAQADVVIAMEIDQIVQICRLFPQHRQKVYLFGCLTGDAVDVGDPVYAPKGVFEACFERIERGVRRIVDVRLRASGVPAPISGVRR